MKGLKEYIIRVCKDSCVSEQRTVNVEFQYAVIEDKLAFAVKCPWGRVLNRISYRLERNLRKNFGLLFCPINEVKGFFDFIPGDIDPNYAFAEWTVFGEWGTLRVGEDAVLNPHLHISSRTYGEKTKFDRLCDAGYADDPEYWSARKRTHEDWEKFCKYYEKAFGDRPYEIKETVSVSVKEGIAVENLF